MPLTKFQACLDRSLGIAGGLNPFWNLVESAERKIQAKRFDIDQGSSLNCAELIRWSIGGPLCPLTKPSADWNRTDSLLTDLVPARLKVTR